MEERTETGKAMSQEFDKLRYVIINTLEAVSPTDWNRLAGAANPFVHHQFLIAMERHGCLVPWGWRPCHVLAYDAQGVLVGALPLYLKDNSYGELVFDGAWAQAYARHGMQYYPKLVSAIPYTPASGPRVLLGPQPVPAVAQGLLQYTVAWASDIGVSSIHWLFPDTASLMVLDALTGPCQTFRRLGYQFHWNNAGYSDFNAFLATFTHDRRKKVRQERQRVAASGLVIESLSGVQIEARHWQIFYNFYRHTFESKGGPATLTLAFFEEIGRTLGEHILLLLVRRQGEVVAGALDFVGSDTLYGRYWGCAEYHPALHFELCYYRGIDYCITHGLQRFEPGAQGEFKIARGFVPTATWSSHWIADPGFRHAIGDFLNREQPLVYGYMAELDTHVPYKEHL